MSATRTKAESMRFLGLNVSMYRKLLKKYEIDSYFEENSLTKNA